MKHKKPAGFDQRMVELVKRNAEAISGCGVFTVIHNEDLGEEILPVIQMGLAVYLDKPVLILCPASRQGSIPKNVRRLATAIEIYDDTLEDHREVEMNLQAATVRLMQAAGMVK